MRGEVVSVNVSDEKGTRKRPVPSAELRAGLGLSGDAHAGFGHRQVSLLDEVSIAKMRGRGVTLAPGDFAENLTTCGLELAAIPVGTRLAVGAEALLEVTQIGKECHLGCEIRRQVGDCVMPREGIFAAVLRGGPVRAGDSIVVVAKGSNP